jgi:hypothetical protein
MRQYCLPLTTSFIVILLLLFLSVLYIQSTPPSPQLDPELKKISSCAYPPLAVHEDLPDEGMVCVMVRTKSEQLARMNYSVRRLMASLEQMEYKNWRAYFFSVNEESISNITEIFAERSISARKNYRVLNLRSVEPRDQDRGYALTDLAIKQCPPDSKWLLVTNADNQYSPKAFSYLDSNSDAFAMDFYINEKLARNHNIFPPDGIDFFPHSEEECTKNHKVCAYNRLECWQNDVGSMIWGYQKWRSEGISYSKYTPSDCHDGQLAGDLRDNGWIITRLPFCFLSLSTNAWSNCRLGIKND